MFTWVRVTARQIIQYSDHSFVSSVLLTDDAGYNRDGIINFHMTQLWAEGNAHGVVQYRH